MSTRLAAAGASGGGDTGVTMSAWYAWTNGRTSDRARNRRRRNVTFGQTANGRPPGAVGVHTVWLMYIVLFVGSALQWLCS